MIIQEPWATTEERLLREEANSFGEVLEQLRNHISPLLIGDREWKGLLDRARELPVTMAAFPFGFELPLHERRPRADLGVSVVGGSRPAVFFEKRGRSKDADASTAGIARLLRDTEPAESSIRQVVGRKMMLEYDIDSTSDGTHPEPGIFLRPARRPIVGDGANQRFRDIGAVLDTIVAAADWDLDAAERRQVEQVYLMLKPDTHVESFGVFPSRKRAIRLTTAGFRTARDIMTFLERVGWSGQHSVVASTVSRFKERGAFVNMGVHFDVRARGLGPALGLSFLAKDRKPNDPRYWLDNPRLWTALIDGLCEDGLAVPEKMSALANWSPGPTMLSGISGPFVLLRGIHHVKLVLTGDRIEEVKGYVFMVLVVAPAS